MPGAGITIDSTRSVDDLIDNILHSIAITRPFTHWWYKETVSKF